MIFHKNNSLLLTVTFIVISQIKIFGQIFYEDFEGANPYQYWDTNTFDLGSVRGKENFWIINNSYSGIAIPVNIPNVPNQPVLIPINTQNYLHIASRYNISTYAIDNASYTYNSSTSGDKYFTSMNIDLNTLGNSNVTLEFWYLNLADGPTGTSGQIYYSLDSGKVWKKTGPNLSNKFVWNKQTIKDTAFDNKATLRFGFLFKNPLSGFSPALSIDEISVSGTPIIATIANLITPPSRLCSGDKITLTAANNNGLITQYKWNFNGANDVSLPQSIFTQTASLTGGIPGNYNIDLIVGNGSFFDTLVFSIDINQCIAPNIQFSGYPLVTCLDSSIVYTQNTIKGNSTILEYNWNFDPYSTNLGITPSTYTGINPPKIKYSKIGLFDVALCVTDSNRTYCDTLKNYIEILDCLPPETHLKSSDSIICPNNCISFTDQSKNTLYTGTTWNWFFEGANTLTSSNQNPNNICYNTPGKYDVRLVVQSFTGSDTLLITDFITVDSCLSPTVNFSVEEDTICEGNCVRFINYSRNIDSVIWFFQGADISYDTSKKINPIVCYSKEGNFNVELQGFNVHGVDIIKKNQYITVGAPPKLITSGGGTTLPGVNFKIEAFGTGTIYEWVPDSNIECAYCNITNVFPDVNTIYSVKHYSELGCFVTDTVRVNVKQEFISGVPEIFSPNDDGINDILFVRGNKISELDFYIYDQLGKLVFESHNIIKGWNGKTNNVNSKPGIYVYYAKVKYINNKEEILKGNVTLIR